MFSREYLTKELAGLDNKFPDLAQNIHELCEAYTTDKYGAELVAMGAMLMVQRIYKDHLNRVCNEIEDLKSMYSAKQKECAEKKYYIEYNSLSNQILTACDCKALVKGEDVTKYYSEITKLLNE